MKTRIGSLFDGSGGFPLAASLCGIEPVWASEVEPYPIAVTRSRFPGMKHLGSVTDVRGDKVEPVDIITFGSPCQDLSIAGKRAGLKHEENGDDETTRSGLFMEAVRIIKEMRDKTDGLYPRFAVWENVPGAFSSNGGEDFRTVLTEFVRVCEPEAPEVPAPGKNGWPYADILMGDGWSIAYRVFDAQYWGVPQRRRRIYLVADFRGQCAGEILFECEGLRGHFAEVGTPWKSLAGDAANRTGADDRTGENGGAGRGLYTVVPYTLKIRSGCEGGGKGPLIQTDKSATLATNNDQYLFQPMNMVLDDQGGQQITVRTDGKAPTLRAETHGNLPCVLEAAGFKAGQSMAGGIGWQKECAATLAAQCSGTEPTVCVKCYDARGNGDGQTVSTLTGDHESRITDYTSVVCMAHGQANAEILENKSPCLNCNHEQPIIFDKEVYNSGVNATGGHYISEGGPSPTLRTSVPPGVCVQYIVRRLTPTECARLQGFPDHWGHPDYNDDFTDEEYRFWLNVRNTHAAINGKTVKEYTKKQILNWYNKLHTDSSEYKMWGNGIALPCAMYVMQGIEDALNKEVNANEEDHESKDEKSR